MDHSRKQSSSPPEGETEQPTAQLLRITPAKSKKNIERHEIDHNDDIQSKAMLILSALPLVLHCTDC